MSKLKVVKLDPEAKLPTKANDGDAGFDLYSLEDRVLFCADNYSDVYRHTFKLGISVEIPDGHCGFITPRSGLAAKKGISVLNSPGLIDSGYRGELGVVLYNSSNYTYLVRKGDKIAQLVLCEVPNIQVEEVEELSTSQRGSDGFGSTGN